MPLDFPAAAEALWELHATCGVRPEFLLPVMWVESAGFQQGIQNMAGAKQWGLIQASEKFLSSRGVDPHELGKQPASWQIRAVVQPFVCQQVRSFGKLQSGVRVYQSIFYPASLKYAPALDDRIVSAPSRGYTDNRVFDADNKGYITPGDLGQTLMKRALTASAVPDAIGQTYVLRPSERPLHAVWGADFIAGWRPFEQRSTQLADWASVATILGGATTAALMLARK